MKCQRYGTPAHFLIIMKNCVEQMDWPQCACCLASQISRYSWIYFSLGLLKCFVYERPIESPEGFIVRISVAVADIPERQEFCSVCAFNSVAYELKLLVAYLSICCKVVDNEDSLSLILRLYSVLHFHYAGSPLRLAASFPTTHSVVKVLCFGEFCYPLQFWLSPLVFVGIYALWVGWAREGVNQSINSDHQFSHTLHSLGWST
ncbi:hypothetical protein AVEN_201996-1 [Araneus ventricosus]|uniref:Uncharacterized protein n=1 Tax=Araneus ventricosus TaxID=182803 RepID=A0A4Y2JAN6_ARAVE|nr:hypothetical protein AVEN_201996-1 [Araneus ventricosus]